MKEIIKFYTFIIIIIFISGLLSGIIIGTEIKTNQVNNLIKEKAVINEFNLSDFTNNPNNYFRTNEKRTAYKIIKYNIPILNLSQIYNETIIGD